MKKLFLYLALIGFMIVPVESGITDTAKKGAMGVGAITVATALAMIVYQSHQIKKLRKEKAALRQSGAGHLDSLGPLIAHHKIDQKIGAAIALRAQALAALTAGGIATASGYFWPKETAPSAPATGRGSSPISTPLLTPRPVSEPVLPPAPATGTGSLPISTPLLTPRPVSEPVLPPAPVVSPSGRDPLKSEIVRIVNVNNMCARRYRSLQYMNIETYSFTDFNAVDCAVQMLAKAFSEMKFKDKATYSACIYWPMRPRTRVKEDDLVSQQQASFFVKYLLEQHALEGSRMNQVAVMVNSVSHAANVPVPLENLVDVVCVPGDGHCGPHIVAAHELLRSYPDQFSPLVYATYDKVYAVRQDLVEWMHDEIAQEVADFAWSCTIHDCFELTGSYQYLLVKAPWVAELFGRFKELYWSDYGNPQYADLVNFFNELNKSADEVEEGKLSRASDVRDSLPKLLKFYHEFVACSALDDQQLRDLDSQEPTGLAKGVGSAYYLNDTEWRLLSYKKQIPVIMCKQEMEKGKPNGKYSFIRFFGKEHCGTVEDILSKALFACNVNENHWVTLVPKKGLVQAAESPKSVSSHA